MLQKTLQAPQASSCGCSPQTDGRTDRRADFPLAPCSGPTPPLMVPTTHSRLGKLYVATPGQAPLPGPPALPCLGFPTETWGGLTSWELLLLSGGRRLSVACTACLSSQRDG